MEHFDYKELGKNEIWIANTNADTFPKKEFSHLKTLRLGLNAYTIDGSKLSPEAGIRPMFIHKSEYDEYNRIWADEISKINRGF